MTAWKEMENAAVAFARAVAGSAANIQNIAINRTGSGPPTTRPARCGWVLPASR